nr:MAG TPA: DNA binding protein [Caudoviricetes sp.]
MENLSMPIDKELALLTTYNLTAEEWWVIKLLFLAMYPESRPEPLKQYSKITGGLQADILESLQEKGVLKKVRIKKGEHLDIDDLQFNFIKGEDGKSYPDIPFSANFLKQYLKHSGELGKELFLAYPTFITINGVQVGARNITTGNHFGNMDDFFFFYGKTIKWDPNAHKQILKILNWAKDSNLISFSISTFVINQKWIELQEAMESGLGTYNGNILI